ncbi:hypothetical protein ACQUQP_05020 [Marinobacterium sp. YM272]|uniref:hypothetical protein n=1 Tax=Marinobacterium sp. YM272 TaxID=3421654 RepID=UPI003D7FD174
MFNKTALEGATTEVLIATAIECSRQQQSLLKGEMDENSVNLFGQYEEIRSYAIRHIAWDNPAKLLENIEALKQLAGLDRQVSKQLEASRDNLAAGIKQLKKKRGASSEYLRFQ